MKKSWVVFSVILLAAGTWAFAEEPGRGMTAIPDDQGSFLKTGRQFLVVIGISKYERWLPLPDAVNDAREVRNILLSRYRVDERRELYNEQATKAAIIKLLEDLQKELKPDDSLLILYSGHGHLDRKSETGFWIPVNAGTDVYEQLNWLPHMQLKGLISRMPSTHVLVISDSCFAGDLLYATRSLPEAADSEYFQKAYSLTSRLVMTSGATEPVPAESTFATQLKSALRRNEEPCLDSLALYGEIRRGMKSTVPLLGALAGAGHQEGACFLLFLKEGTGKRAPGNTPLDSLRIRRWVSDGGFWIGGGFLPLFEVSQRFSVGPALLSQAILAVQTPVGTFGVAIQAGAAGFPTAPGWLYDYLLLSFPFAVDLRYQAAIGTAFFFSVDVAGGVTVSEALFHQPGIAPTTDLSTFLSAAMTIGQQLGQRVRVSAGVGCVAILFKSLFFAVSPIVRVEYALVAPEPPP